MDYIFSIITVALLACGFAFQYKAIKNAIPLDEHRTRAKRQFRAHRTRSADARFAFNGEEAEILKSDESIVKHDGVVSSYCLTCYAKNVSGEYFMFVSNHEAQPFFKHICHTNANIILGDDYVTLERLSGR